MIKQFSTLQPLNIVLLLVFTLVMRLPILLQQPNSIDFPLVESFSTTVFGLPSQQLAVFTNVSIASVLVFSQALIFNYIINHFGILSKSSYLPALMYITVSSIFIPFMVLSAPLIANFFLLALLYKLFSFNKPTNGLSATYDMGLIISIGTLIYFPFASLLLLLWLGLLIYRPFNWREWVAGLLGVFTVFFFIAVYYYLNGLLPSFFKIWLPFKEPFTAGLQIDRNDYIGLSPVLVVVFLAIINLRENFFKTYINTRKALQILFLLVILVLISHYTKPHIGAIHYVLGWAPIALFCAYYFSVAKRKWLYESLFLLMIIIIQSLLFV